MKFSIFFTLLAFNLSAFLLPRTFSFPPVFDITSSPFFLQQTPSPLFQIKRSCGLYIWRIPMTENVVEYTENYEAYLAHTLSIYWSIKPDLIRLWRNPYKTICVNINLNPEETYILLRINRNKECEGFYWIGADTGPAKRQLTARLLVRMMFDLKIQQPESKLIHLSREERHKESDLFLQIFHAKKKTRRIPRLFKVSGEEGQLIMEVPPRYNELNGSNAFVLDRMSFFINIWNPNPNEENENKTKIVRALANRLKEVDKLVIKDQVQIIDRNKVGNFCIFQRIFLEILYKPYGQPPVWKFPMDPSSVTEEEWTTARNEHLKLFEYSFDGYLVTLEEIHDRPLRMEHLKPNKAHVITDSYTGNVFMHIGKNAHHAVSEQAMAAGEIINWRLTMYPWQKVTLIYQADEIRDNLPTHFIVNFAERMSFLQNYITCE